MFGTKTSRRIKSLRIKLDTAALNLLLLARVAANHEHVIFGKVKKASKHAVRPASKKSSQNFEHHDRLMHGQTVFKPCILKALEIIPQLRSYPLYTLSPSFKKINNYVLPKRLFNLCLDFLSKPLGYSARTGNDKWMCWTTQRASLICGDHLLNGRANKNAMSSSIL